MATISVDIEEIPHGHGLSFKRGVSDGLLDINEYEHEVHATNKASYRRGIEAGQKLKEEISKLYSIYS